MISDVFSLLELNLPPKSTTLDSARSRTLASLEFSAQGTRASNLRVRNDRVVPTFWPIRAHDIKMRSITVLILRLATPLRVSIRWTQVRYHDGDFLACAGTVALACGRDRAHIGQLEALTTPASAPG